MNKYLSCVERYKSLIKHYDNNDSINLATSGFHYNKNDELTCFFCKMSIPDWNHGDDEPLDIHYSKNPECNFVKSIYLPIEMRYDVVDKTNNDVVQQISRFFRNIADAVDEKLLN